MDRVHCLFKADLVVGVSEKVAVIEHVNPDLPIGENLGRECILQHLPGRDRGKDKAALFQVILHGLPCEFEAILESLDDAFLFQLIQCRGAPLHRVAQKHECSVEVLKALFPADVGIPIHEVKFRLFTFARIFVTQPNRSINQRIGASRNSTVPLGAFNQSTVRGQITELAIILAIQVSGIAQRLLRLPRAADASESHASHWAVPPIPARSGRSARRSR